MHQQRSGKKHVESIYRGLEIPPRATEANPLPKEHEGKTVAVFLDNVVVYDFSHALWRHLFVG